MRNVKVLEMINDGKIEQLKALLAEEIYQDSLKGKSNAKSRYAAMKRFFRYNNKSAIEASKYPCKDVKVKNELYNSFLDGYCFALTTESIGEMEAYDNSSGTYLNIDSLVNFDKAESVERIDFNKVFAKAKSLGYKYSKLEFDAYKFQYVLKYKDSHYKISLLDKSYSVINDGELAEVYYIGLKSPLLIKTSIGIAGVMPFHTNNTKEVKTIIYIED